MNEPSKGTATTTLPPIESAKNPTVIASLRKLGFAAMGIALCFSIPFYHLFRFALKSQLYSHILLIPFISAYLIWLRRDGLAQTQQKPKKGWAVGFLAAGLGFLLWRTSAFFTHKLYTENDLLALSMYAFVFLLAGLAVLLADRQSLRILAFPLGFLVFLAPFPTFIEEAFESFLQHGSAPVAYVFFKIAGTPVFREGTFFRLPSFSMEVAPECSGIHSTFALFLTSLVAGQLLLRSSWKRYTLAAIVLPLALVRNGFRVFTIGELCVHIGPEMIESPIHRQGGPLFFILSLVPFALILFYLHKSDRFPPSSAKLGPN